jgi:hypothetical protein
MLNKQVIEIPFVQGVESGKDRRLVPQDRLTQCHNGRITQQGRIEKRLPYVAVGKTLYTAVGGTATTQSTPTQLGECDGQLLAVDGEWLQACANESTGIWRQCNRLPATYCTRERLYAATRTRQNASSAVIAKMAATAFCGDDYEIRALVHDTDTGEILVAEKVLTSHAVYTVFRILAVGTWFVLFYVNPTTGELHARCLDSDAPSLGWSWEETITGTHLQDLANTAIDAIPVTGSTTDIIVAYNESTAGLIAQKFRRDHATETWSTINTSTPITETSAIAHCVREDGDADRVLVAWIGASGGGTPNRPRWMILTSSLGASVAPANLTSDNAGACNIITACARPGTHENWCVLYDNGAGVLSRTSPTSYARITFVPTSGAVAGTPQRLQGYSLASTPQIAAGQWATFFVAAHSTGEAQSSYFFVRHYDSTWLGNGYWYLEALAAPRQSGGARDLNTATTLVSPSTSSYWCALQTGSDGVYTQSVERFVFTRGSPYRFVSVGGCTLVLGSQPVVYDGVHCTGLAFPLWPDKIEDTPAATGGGIDAGTYYYRVVLAYRHADGRVERSASSAAIEVIHAAGATNSVTLRIPHKPLDRHWSTDPADVATPSKPSQAFYEIYRTTATDSLNFHLLPLAATTNVTNDATYSDVVDTFADAAITEQPYIYTTEAAGEPVANTCPGTARFGCVHRGRVWLAGCEDPYLVWFSKYMRAGEGIAFSDEFTLDFRDQGQPITGLASLEDKLVVFTASQTFVVYGDGPVDAGGDPGLDPPLRVSAQIGCIEDRSIVQCPAGVFFMARDGIFQIDKGLGVTFGGAPALETVRAYPYCYAAIHAESEHQVRWLLGTATTPTSGSSIILSFDYLHGQWITAKAVNGSSVETSALHMAAVSGVGHIVAYPNGTYVVARESSTAKRQDNLNGEGYYSLRLETANIHIGAIQGYQRAWRAVLNLDHKTPHKLTVKVAYDYEATYGTAKTWTAAELAALGTEQLQISFGARQHAQAFRVYLADSADGTVGASTAFEANAIGFEVGVAPGLRRLPTATRR